MNKEEKSFCETCPKHNNCGYVTRGMEDRCVDLAAFSDGYNVAIRKTIEWMEFNINGHAEVSHRGGIETVSMTSDFAQDYKEYMEDRV